VNDLDLAAYKAVFPDWAKRIGLCAKVGLLSPWSEQTALLRELFPDAKVTALSKREWDLNNPGKESFDLLAAMSVLYLAEDPGIWLRNILARCRVFWMQDHVRRRRGGPDTEFVGESADGVERWRFALPGFRPEADVPTWTVPLERLTAWHVYSGGERHGRSAVHFLAAFRGEL